VVSAGIAPSCAQFRGTHRSSCWEPAETVSELQPTGRRLTVVVADYDSGLRLTETARGRRVVIVTYSDSEAENATALARGARVYLLLVVVMQDLGMARLRA